MTRRIGTVVAAACVVVLGAASPARADDMMTVTVAESTPGQVMLTAFAGSGAQPPTVTVSHDGVALRSRVEVVRSPKSPSDSRAVVVVLGPLTGATLQTAEDAVVGFAGSVPADVEVGVVTAGDAPSVLVRPTRDRDAVRTALSSLDPGVGTGSGSVYGGLSAAAGLVAAYPDRRLLVLTDGQNTADATDTAQVGKALAAAGTRVDVVAFRAAGGSARARQLTDATGGVTYLAAGPDALADGFRSAAAAFRLRLAVAVTIPASLAGSSGSLNVTATANGTKLSAAVPVTFAASPRTAAAGGIRVPAIPVRPVLLAGAVFVVVFLLALLATAPLRRPVRAQRLSQVSQFRLTVREVRKGGPTVGPGGDNPLVRAIFGLSDRVVKLNGAEGRIGHRLDQAGMTVSPQAWILLRVATTVGGALVLALPAGVIGFLLGGVLGWLAPGLYRRMRDSRRKRTFAEQLPDALQLVVGSLKSGFSLVQAVDAISRDLPPGPLATALGRVVSETRIGADVSDAIERAAQRVGNDDLQWVVMAIRIQRETGGNLAEVLETTVETLRERERLRRHVWALSAEGRLSAYILIALPIVIAAWLFLTRRDYMRPLWTTPIGLLMLIGSALLLVVGAFWMSRWVKVEV